MNTPSPSPLVPQGAIPPKNTSKPARVLTIAAIVVFCHVGGLIIILAQGCQKDALKSASGGAETNTPPLTLPTVDTNPSPYYAAASNLPPVSVAPTQQVAVTPPPVVTNTGATMMEPPTSASAAGTGQASDYKVAKGDTLAAIAKKNHVSIGAIQAANGNIDPKRLMPGQTIKIPAAAPAAPSTVASTGSTRPMATGTLAATESGAAAKTYTVKPGDNLTKIARAHGITVKQLQAANGIKTTQVQAGKTLKIPAKTATAAAVPSGATAAR